MKLAYSRSFQTKINVSQFFVVRTSLFFCMSPSWRIFYLNTFIFTFYGVRRGSFFDQNYARSTIISAKVDNITNPNTKIAKSLKNYSPFFVYCSKTKTLYVVVPVV